MEYDPENIDEDFLIEDILQRAFIDEILQKQESKLDFDYYKLALKKGKLIQIKK